MSARAWPLVPPNLRRKAKIMRIADPVPGRLHSHSARDQVQRRTSRIHATATRPARPAPSSAARGDLPAADQVRAGDHQDLPFGARTVSYSGGPTSRVPSSAARPSGSRITSRGGSNSSFYARRCRGLQRQHGDEQLFWTVGPDRIMTPRRDGEGEPGAVAVIHAIWPDDRSGTGLLEVAIQRG